MSPSRTATSSGRKFAKKSSVWNLLRALRAAEHVYPFWEEMGI